MPPYGQSRDSRPLLPAQRRVLHGAFSRLEPSAVKVACSVLRGRGGGNATPLPDPYTGFDDKEPARQRYKCKDCKKHFDDRTGTIFAGHHQPLKVWILCLYFMGLNLSNKQIAKELNLDRSEVQQMTTQLREGVVKKSPK